ncbi:isoprenoid synthase domain-containing protein [Melanogaster broomeanus]|nr:isoprenoid synthase domain-containing protein [Melanogaster broomeanus]
MQPSRRGHPVSTSGPFSVHTSLREGIAFGAIASVHLSDTHRALQIWNALFTGYAFCVDDMPRRFPEEMPNISAFNDRFVRGEKQGNAVLDALSDVMKEIPRVFGGPVPANLVMTSALNFVTGTVIERETMDMQIMTTAKQYPTYQRTLSGFGEGHAFTVFPPDIPFDEYIQAIPEICLFNHNVNDILSFYKEELAGEPTNQISAMAACKGVSKVAALEELVDTSGELYERIVSILEVPPRSRACEAFKLWTRGYFLFHASLERYRLMEVMSDHGKDESRL